MTNSAHDLALIMIEILKIADCNNISIKEVLTFWENVANVEEQNELILQFHDFIKSCKVPLDYKIDELTKLSNNHNNKNKRKQNISEIDR